MFIEQKRHGSYLRRGFTLVEMFIAVGLGVMIIGAVMASFMFCSRNMLAVANYAKLNQADQLAIDKLTREIRGMGGLTNYTVTTFSNSIYPNMTMITNRITLYAAGSTTTNSWVTYGYDPIALTLTRSQGSNSQIYLTNCGYLNFSFFQRNQSNGAFIPVATTNASMTKIVQIAWNCSQSLTFQSENESVKSAKVVIRCK